MTTEHWDGLLTELGAGRSLKGCGDPKPDDSLDVKLAQTWNAAHERCMRIVESYRDGEGLFQLTTSKSKKAGRP